jgi:hypothetical protein
MTCGTHMSSSLFGNWWTRPGVGRRGGESPEVAFWRAVRQRSCRGGESTGDRGEACGRWSMARPRRAKIWDGRRAYVGRWGIVQGLLPRCLPRRGWPRSAAAWMLPCGGSSARAEERATQGGKQTNEKTRRFLARCCAEICCFLRMIYLSDNSHYLILASYATKNTCESSFFGP